MGNDKSSSAFIGLDAQSGVDLKSDTGQTLALNPAQRVIVALDYTEPKQAMSLAKQLKGQAVWMKVGITLYYAAGPSIVAELKALGFNVFVDAKLFDIPHQVHGAAISLTQSGADLFTVHGLGGLEMMQAAAEGAQEAAEVAGKPSPRVVAITVLTSMDERMLARTGIMIGLREQVLTLAYLSQEAGLDGVVASPLELELLRSKLGEKPLIITPGIRPSDAQIGDQSRVATPSLAIAAGANYLVIGRPITAAAD
ncbi:MAG: orotidine-5'-phosphate decarboxylase, partial [Coriobacteriales bacterium]|nr:orotidine-5'-phosphate decarboxylase [Coriobacteriales bacterium]